MMKLSSGDMNVVANLRYQYKDALAKYSDLLIAETWREFSQSEDYEHRDDNPDLFLKWWIFTMNPDEH